WPFGEEMTSPASQERMRFAGHERDASTGYDYMHARYYASVAGRFLSVDPGRDYDPKSPQSFNLYAYVRNNPVSATDPDGRVVFAAVPAWYLGAGFVAAAGAYLMAPSVTHPGKSNAQVMGEMLVSLGQALARRLGPGGPAPGAKDKGLRRQESHKQRAREEHDQRRFAPKWPQRPGGGDPLPPGAPGPHTPVGERPHLQNGPDERDFLRYLPGAELLRRIYEGTERQPQQLEWKRDTLQEQQEEVSKALVNVTETASPVSGN
ncbi:MAG: RHS repeat-associated core domain-containing protein, partial [Thermoanaerobaculum sp.]